MKIFSTAPEGNEMAELENARYFNLALKHIAENAEWLKTTNKPVQALLTHIDILVMLAKRFPIDANLSINKDRVQEWKQVLTIGLSVVAIRYLSNTETVLKPMAMNFLTNWKNMDIPVIFNHAGTSLYIKIKLSTPAGASL